MESSIKSTTMTDDGLNNSLTIGDLLKQRRKRQRNVLLDSDTDDDFADNNSYEIVNNTTTHSSVAAMETSDDESDEDEQVEHVQEPVDESAPAQWNMECEFPDKIAFDNFLQTENWWSLRGSSDTVKGKKILYRCNLVRRVGPQCAAAIYVIVKESYADEAAAAAATEINESGNKNNNNNNDVIIKKSYALYRKSLNHTHEQIESKSPKVSPAAQQMIIDKFKNGKKAKTISYELLDDDKLPKSEKPSYKQIRNIITNYKNSQYGQNPISMNQITEFFNEHSAVPQDEDVAFIVNFERSPSYQQNDQFFRLFVSTPRLLRMAVDATIIHSDATHKVTTEKLPLLAIGVTDINKVLHFTGLTLSCKEKIADYEFTFNAFKQGIHSVTGQEFTGKPLTLVSDADPAIHRGFENCFGEWVVQIIMCYFHVMLNVQNKYKFHGSANKKTFKEDLYVLHICSSEQQFDEASRLFVRKWKNVEPEATRLIDNSFFKANKNWFIGCAYRMPKHNNSLESFNSTMKRYQTEHRRQPLKIFLSTALTIVRQRSKEYLLDKKPFSNEFCISDRLLQKGFDLVASNRFNYVNGEEMVTGEMDFFVFASKIRKAITLEDVNTFSKRKYKTFADFEDNAFDIWKITFPADTTKWQMSICTCPAFDEENMCKHIIAIAADLNLVVQSTVAVANYDDEPLFVAKRGRPKKATAGLIRDSQ